MNKLITVNVYNHHTQSRHVNRPLAYTRYNGSGACVHKVLATNGNEAKKMAIQEHLMSRSCSQVDKYCDVCQSSRLGGGSK